MSVLTSNFGFTEEGEFALEAFTHDIGYESCDWDAIPDASSSEPLIQELSSLINDSVGDLINDFGSVDALHSTELKNIEAAGQASITCNGPCGRTFALKDLGLTEAPQAWNLVCPPCQSAVQSTYTAPNPPALFESEE
eukprot:GFYU01000510.1.p1 GENE.GFYU01000510.1~~GFYU01000510.1.p1  ORF type:complete len:138 (+),score=29.30 GFYU01000510.1:166-579(+)